MLAATNRPDVLDPALLRPGRFDRHVVLDLPDRNDRVAILKVHVRKVPLDADVDFDRIAAGTPGFSGADIKNLVNEAAMIAARKRHDAVSMQDFEESRDKLLLGSVRTLAIQPEERHRLAVHESGHATVAYFLPFADPLYKVTIIPRGSALGGTQQLPEVERHTLPEEYLRAWPAPWWRAGACPRTSGRWTCARARNIPSWDARSRSHAATASIPPRPWTRPSRRCCRRANSVP